MKEIAIIFITVIVVLFAAAGCINLYKKKKYEKTLYFVQKHRFRIREEE